MAISGYRTLPGMTFSPASPAAPASAPAGASTDPFSMFSDPATNFLTQTIKSQLGQLAATPTDPTTSALNSVLSSQLGSLASASPVSFNVSNPLLTTFTTQAEQRINELNQAPYTDAQTQAMMASTRNDLATQRDQAKQRLMEDASRRGLAPSSGIVGQEIANLEGQTTAQDAKNQNDLMLQIAQKTQDNKNLATTIAGQLAQAGQAQAGLDLSAQEGAAQINNARTSQILGIATTLANLAAQQRGETRARQGDILALATQLANLPLQRLQTVSSILNGSTPSPGSVFNDTLAFNNAQQGAQNASNTAYAQFLNGLSTYAGYLANS